MAIAYSTVGVLLLLLPQVALSQSPSCSTGSEEVCEFQTVSAASLMQLGGATSFLRTASLHENRDEACNVCNLDFSTVANSPFDGSSVFQTAAAGLKVTFANACTVNGQTLDLVLISTSDYTAKYSNNKVVGNMFEVNLKSGTSVTWNFQLVSAGTAQSVEVDNVILSVLDLDSSGTVFQQIMVDGFSAVAAGEGICSPQAGVFAAMKDGNADDNPTSSMNLDSAQEDSVLSLSFKKVSRWQISMSIPQEIDGGRNFFLAGPTKLMPTTAVCADTMQSTQVPLCPWSPTPAPTTTLPPTPKPKPMPTEPTEQPTTTPTDPPIHPSTPEPTVGPTVSPTVSPSVTPTHIPTVQPTTTPTYAPRCPNGPPLITTPIVAGEVENSWILASNGTVYGSGRHSGRSFKEYLTGVKTMVSADDYTLFLMENGVVCGKGRYPSQMPLCNVAPFQMDYPVVVMTGVASISAAKNFDDSPFSIFLKGNGDLWGCGVNTNDKFGDLSRRHRRGDPALVMKNVSRAWAGSKHILMEMLNGSTILTGRKTYLQPPPPPAVLKPFGAATGKFWYKAANGTLFGHGYCKHCEMGLSPVDSLRQPVPVVDHIRAVDSFQHTVFLVQNGTAYTSGWNFAGQLGDGTKLERCSGLHWAMDHVQAVAIGRWTTILLGKDGTVYASGDNRYFQLGNLSMHQEGSKSFVKIMAIN